MGYEPAFLQDMVKNIEKNYSPYLDRTGKKPRWIARPSETLKGVQRKILDNFLELVSLPNYVIGGVKGRKHAEHPKLHVGHPIVVTLDVKDCYPNITYKQVLEVFREIGFSKEVAVLATRLTTYRRRLPLGAPSSTQLANLILKPAVTRVCALAEQAGLDVASQYIDDLAFSGDQLPNDFITLAIREFSRHMIKINRKKIQVMRRGHTQLVTRRLVNARVALPTKERHRVRAALHQLGKLEASDSSYSKQFLSVRGRILSLRKLHPHLGQRLMAQLNSLQKSTTKKTSH
ncbi:MAG: RNA-directed DNA polymerase [Candidatus Omnitrophica bacterium]|nr:RNA-directed DNA polymerase [Candidatus Omnitrophota bacterium]